ncbi:MAG: acetyl-CoA carboxylase biotin carboxyl carrier protein subunit [Polyangiaceae bacterium]
MRYYVSLNPNDEAQTPIEVDVAELPNGSLDVKIGGKPVAVDLVPIQDARDSARLGGSLSVRIGGRIVDLTVEGSPPDVGIVASGHRSYVRVVSERERAADAARRGGGGTKDSTVKSPMPGRIVKIMVNVGDEVNAGDSLLVVEAMKMENEIKAKQAGKIAEIHVAAGATVEANGKLVTFA